VAASGALQALPRIYALVCPHLSSALTSFHRCHPWDAPGGNHQEKLCPHWEWSSTSSYLPPAVSRSPWVQNSTRWPEDSPSRPTASDIPKSSQPHSPRCGRTLPSPSAPIQWISCRKLGGTLPLPWPFRQMIVENFQGFQVVHSLSRALSGHSTWWQARSPCPCGMGVPGAGLNNRYYITPILRPNALRILLHQVKCSKRTGELTELVAQNEGQGTNHH